MYARMYEKKRNFITFEQCIDVELCDLSISIGRFNLNLLNDA